MYRARATLDMVIIAVHAIGLFVLVNSTVMRR
jgi:hypothetical protein